MKSGSTERACWAMRMTKAAQFSVIRIRLLVNRGPAERLSAATNGATTNIDGGGAGTRGSRAGRS